MVQLPALPYDYNALEPFIDEQTMHIHRDKHHQTYLDKLNQALEKYPKLHNTPVEELIKNPRKIPAEIRISVLRNGGQHYNHSFFFDILGKGTKPHGNIFKKIEETFNGFDNFKKQFLEASTTLFGSGWAWLVLNNDKRLEIIQTPNHESPIMENKIPIIVIDVWEHAYYLKYQNKRTEYIEAFFNVINWDKVEDCYNMCFNAQ